MSKTVDVKLVALGTQISISKYSAEILVETTNGKAVQWWRTGLFSYFRVGGFYSGSTNVGLYRHEKSEKCVPLRILWYMGGDSALTKVRWWPAPGSLASGLSTPGRPQLFLASF